MQKSLREPEDKYLACFAIKVFLMSYCFLDKSHLRSLNLQVSFTFQVFSFNQLAHNITKNVPSLQNFEMEPKHPKMAKSPLLPSKTNTSSLYYRSFGSQSCCLV